MGKIFETHPLTGAKFAILVVVALQVVSALMGTDVFFIFVLIYGLLYLYFYRSADVFTKIQNYLSYPFIAAFILLNLGLLTSGGILEMDSFDLRLLLMPVFMLIVTAAAYRAIRWWRVDSRDIAMALAAGLLVGVPVLLVLRGVNFDLSLFYDETRSAGVLNYNTNLADDVYAFSALVALLGVSCLSRGSRAQKVFAAVLAVPLLAVFTYSFWFLIQGQSRGAWVAIVSAVLIVVALRLVSGRPVPYSKAALALMAVVIIAKSDVILFRAGEEPISITSALSQLFSSPVGYASAAPNDEELFAAQNNGELSSTEIRLLIWRDGLRLLKVHPLQGFSGRNVEAMTPYTQTPQVTFSYSHFHNLFLDVGVRFGLVVMVYYLIVFALFVVTLGCAVLSMRGRSTSALNGLLYASLAYFTYLGAENVFDVNLHQKAITSIVIAFCAIAGAALALHENAGESAGERAVPA
ncbi:O-antigen ligase family protein [Mesorhizobium sp. NBSH29]|uniref:O-antigen ligase family protein n=1 Tax=Mesorhizobium sp. NBSH29 TaxID=2654249 RepID=UPI0018964D2B|nr:O-antigen ligase family protein [Mesorhizobium sp. NBSH29]